MWGWKEWQMAERMGCPLVVLHAWGKHVGQQGLGVRVLFAAC